MGNLKGWEWVILLLIVLLLFGASRLPGLAKSLGQSMRIFRSEVKAPPVEPGTGAQPTSGPTGPTATGATGAGSTHAAGTPTDDNGERHSL